PAGHRVADRLVELDRDELQRGAGQLLTTRAKQRRNIVEAADLEHVLGLGVDEFAELAQPHGPVAVELSKFEDEFVDSGLERRELHSRTVAQRNRPSKKLPKTRIPSTRGHGRPRSGSAG